MFEDFSKIEKRFKEIGEKSEILEMILFYDKVLKVFREFGEDLQIIDINPSIESLAKDKYSLDFGNFIILIGDMKYLVFLKRGEIGFLNEKDFDRFIGIYSNDITLGGIIVVWYSQDLPAIMFREEVVPADYNAVLKELKKDITELKKILKYKVDNAKNNINIIKESVNNLREKHFTKEISLDIMNEFERDLHNSYEERKERYQTQRRELLNSIEYKTFQDIIKLFNDFFSKRIEKENLEEYFKKIVENNFEK